MLSAAEPDDLEQSGASLGQTKSGRQDSEKRQDLPPDVIPGFPDFPGIRETEIHRGKKMFCRARIRTEKPFVQQGKERLPFLQVSGTVSVTDGKQLPDIRIRIRILEIP